VPRAPGLVFGARGIATRPRGISGGVRLLVVAPRPLPFGARGATLSMLDMTLGYRWRWLYANVDLENLLNLQLREGEYNYASRWRPDQPLSELPALHTTAGAPFNASFTIGATF